MAERLLVFGAVARSHPDPFIGGTAHADTVPSLLASSRITSIGETLGTIDQDRSTGVSGRFGPGPSLVPVNVQLLSPERDRV